jgi:hypothetical protein
MVPAPTCQLEHLRTPPGRERKNNNYKFGKGLGFENKNLSHKSVSTSGIPSIGLCLFIFVRWGDLAPLGFVKPTKWKLKID